MPAPIMYRSYFYDEHRVGCGERGYFLVAEGRKHARILLIGSGEFLRVPREFMRGATTEDIGERRARRAVKNIIERRRMCGVPVTKELRTLRDTIGKD